MNKYFHKDLYIDVSPFSEKKKSFNFNEPNSQVLAYMKLDQFNCHT